MRRATWAWAESRDAETWIGFPSRAKAEAHGRRVHQAKVKGFLQLQNVLDCSPGFVAPCVWPDPADIAMRVADIDRLLEEMDDYASELFYAEDPPFKLTGGRGAERAFARAIGAWAKRYVRATQFTVDSEKAEAVTP